MYKVTAEDSKTILTYWHGFTRWISPIPRDELVELEEVHGIVGEALEGESVRLASLGGDYRSSESRTRIWSPKFYSVGFPRTV